MRRLLLSALLMSSFPMAVHAANQTVLGNQLVVKDGGVAAKRKIVVVAKELATDDSILGNPVTSGAAITITANGTTPAMQTFQMPAGTSLAGKAFWSGDAVKGFKYKDALGENGPVKGAQVKKAGSGVFLIKALIDGKLGTISVLPPNAGTDGCALLAIHGGDFYSVAFQTGILKNKGTKLFKVTKPTTEATCGRCGDGIVDPEEQCDAPGTACGTSPGAVCSADCTCPCDFLDPSECMFPFPSDYLTVADATSHTTRRVHFAPSGMPHNVANSPFDVTEYNRSDGFSAGSTILVHVQGVDVAQTGAAPITDIARSLDSSSPIVLVNTATLAHHIHWAEIDSNATSSATGALIIHPAVNLDEGTRYIVALRHMKNASGASIAPNPDFVAYRDNTPTGSPMKEVRRAHMEDLFTTLAAAGVPRGDLYLAWDFTVASRQNNTERLLAMRDDAFAALGSAAPAFVVSSTSTNDEITGSPASSGDVPVPRYIDSTTAPARLVLDANGIPVRQATTQPALFMCIIPTAALPGPLDAAIPARASIYGHGLLGSHTEVGAGNVRDMANEHNFVFCATKWIGMSDEDVGNAVAILQNLSRFPSLTDRLQQSMVDQLFLARLMIHPDGFASDPAFQDASGDSAIDPSAVFYDGNSQGGIFGGTVMGIAQDITRGVLGVPGMNYSLLLTRSTDFAAYSAFLYPAYTNEFERPLGLALIQMLWDRSDSNGYARHIMNDPLPGTPPHDVLIHVAFGDHQVANVATDVEARTIGASIHQPAINLGRNPDVTPYYGIPAISGYPFAGSAMVVWDSGAATPPLTNTAPSTPPDPHSDPRKSAVGRNQKSEFLKIGGAVVDVCSGAPCTIP
ncbi:MAG: hypothetical protein U0807_10960 [Candidatus Binatia bacterium]